jgi:glycosyltransferase involved in cell wall biosynthesis
MRIAILGSVALSVPPPKQGGTEWIAYYQAKGLADLGHKVILFAPSGSQKSDSYELIDVGKGSIDTDVSNATFLSYTESSRKLRIENVNLAIVMEKLMERKDDFDLILNNMRGEAVFLPFANAQGKPFVNVMHLPIFAELAEIFKSYNTPLITISEAQRKGFFGLNFLATIGNCVDTDRFLFNAAPADYLLMMGTIGRHKNQGAAIRVAKNLGMKLVLAGKIRDADYYKELQKDIDGEIIKWMGELGFEEKLRLYQNAKALLFPILWEEPFGLVMIEAMACGTPVVAYKNGAIPEVVVDGKTGFVVESNTEEEMIEAVKKIDTIKREDCRKHVLENFTVEKMVRDYEKALLSL